MSVKVIPVLLAGGAGTRLWPVSRDGLPKQFRPIVGDLSTYQQTLRRVSNPEVFTKPVVITSDAFRFFAEGQAQEVGCPATVVLEPFRRDSAAAMAVAAVLAETTSPGSFVLALSADHVVLDDDLFVDAVQIGIQAAAEGKIVVFGLPPTEPNTSYGYIRPGEAFEGSRDLHTVRAFVEKPDRATAVTYVTSGYLWNSGNFLFRSDVMLREFERFAPEVLTAAQDAVNGARADLAFTRIDEAAFARAPRISVDYAIIEKTADIAVVTGRFRWSDIGSWDAIWQVLPKDEQGNAVHGKGVTENAAGCLIHSEGMLTTVVGAENLVVVATPDAVMVVPRSETQRVKHLVEQLHKKGHPEATTHLRDYRPWGYVETRGAGARFALRRVVVQPGRALSLQRHMHRAEHWVIVQGTAKVSLEGQTRLLSENESLYVPPGITHRLENPGEITLELIEVRTGSYLGEDDVEYPKDAPG